MATFQQRLIRAQQAGNLTVADLSRWFGRPDPTVRGWVRRGTEPSGGPQDRLYAETALRVLEAQIADRRGFPLAGTPAQKAVTLFGIRKRVLKS